MVFYHITQYGKQVASHHDELSNTEEGERAICRRIVEKAKALIVEGKLSPGAFDVIVCDEKGQEIDCFLSGTDYKY
jgi:hypothetical protein